MRVHGLSALIRVGAFLSGALLASAGMVRGGGRMVVMIDTVEVTARPIMAEEDVDVYGGTTTTVGRRQVEDLGARDLPSALRLLPGVTISRYNLVGSYGGGEGGSVYIRGQGAGRPGSEIKVYVDGAPREVGVWSHPVMDIVPIDYASSIDVYKGPQPYVYGGTFGTVDVSTMKRVRAGYETSVDLTFGEYDTFGGVLRHGGKVGALDYYVGGAYRRSDGHRVHADGRVGSQFVRLGLDASSGIHVGYVLQHTDNWSRDPGRIDGPTPERDRFATETLSHNLRLDRKGAGLDGYALVYYEDGRIRWEKDHLAGPGTPAGNSDTDWKNYGFRGSADVARGDLGVTVGLEVEDEGGEFRNTTTFGTVPFRYEGRFTTFAPALAARYRIGLRGAVVVPSLGMRYYTHSRFASEAAPHAGLMLESGGWRIFAAYSRGVSYPGVYAVGVATSTIDTLEAEVLDHAEAGVKAALGEGVDVQVSVFRDRADNLMEFTPAGLVNTREYDVTGLEAGAAVAPRRDLSLYGAITLLHPKHEKTPRAPGFSGSAGANYKPVSRLKLTLDIEYVTEQYAFNARSGAGAIAGIEELPAYFVLNAGVAFDVSGYVPIPCRLSLSVENLADETYAFQPGYPMPGRTVFVTARLGSG